MGWREVLMFPGRWSDVTRNSPEILPRSISTLVLSRKPLRALFPV